MILRKDIDGRRSRKMTFAKLRESRRRIRQTETMSQIPYQKSVTDLPGDDIDYNNDPSITYPHSRISAELEPNNNVPTVEVVVRIHGKTNSTGNNTLTDDGMGTGVVVRAEEALIVIIVLLLWVAAIALFFNRWGKIRMLEPYQPKFQENQHRKSCPLPEPPPHVHHRASMSRACGTCSECGFGSQTCNFHPAYSSHSSLLRPRQNSVVVGSTNAMSLIPESPARRCRSVADLPTLSESPSSITTPTHQHHQAPFDVDAYVTVSTVTDV